MTVCRQSSKNCSNSELKTAAFAAGDVSLSKQLNAYYAAPLFGQTRIKMGTQELQSQELQLACSPVARLVCQI